MSLNMGVKHICAYIPLDLYERLLKIKAETGKSMNDIVYEALQKAYGKQEGGTA